MADIPKPTAEQVEKYLNQWNSLENIGGNKMTKQCFYCSYPNKDTATRCINCGMELSKYWDKSGDRPRLVDEMKK